MLRMEQRGDQHCGPRTKSHDVAGSSRLATNLLFGPVEGCSTQLVERLVEWLDTSFSELYDLFQSMNE